MLTTVSSSEGEHAMLLARVLLPPRLKVNLANGGIHSVCQTGTRLPKTMDDKIIRLAHAATDENDLNDQREHAALFKLKEESKPRRRRR
jgi:hypothetical protein